MRHHFNLVLTASFLFLSQGVQGSPLNHDDDNVEVDQGAVTAQVSTAVSPSTPAPATDQPDTRSLIQKTRQPGNITALDFLAQTILLEWMSADPVTRHNLLQTCRYYRAFVMPILGETHLIEPSLLKDLLISIIAGQTGDVELFFRDQRKTFEQLSILELKEAIATGYYNGALSPKTKHGQTYRTIGPQSVGDDRGERMLDLIREDLRLVPLNFSGTEGITQLHLFNNQLKVLDLSKFTGLKSLHLSDNQLETLDLSKLTALESLFLSYNQLKELNLSQQRALQELHLSANQLKELDLSQQTALKTLNLSNNQLKELDLSQLTALETLNLARNQLTMAPDVSQNTALNDLHLDVELCREQSLLATLRGLNVQRDVCSKINLIEWFRGANGIMIGERINLV